MKIKYFLPIIIFCLTFILWRGTLFATPVDLNTFTADPSGNVVITSDGFSATLYEDDLISPIFLRNLSFAIPLDALSLSFDYALVVPVDNEDYFDFYIDNIEAPTFPRGGPEGTYSDPYSYDLTALRGQIVPVVFDLTFDWWGLDFGFDSYVTISNVNLNPVPEPGTMFLLAIGILGVIGLGKKYRNT